VFAFCQFGFNLDQSQALPERGGKVESKNLPFIHRTAQLRPNYITFEAKTVDLDCERNRPNIGKVIPAIG
jgi:hypothetical protein